MSVGVTNVVSKESSEATKPDFSIGHSIVSGRTNAQKIQAKKKKQRWRYNVKMRKTSGENIGGVENLFHDCSNNNFKESNGKEGTSAHANDGGDSDVIIFAGGEAKSQSATINKTLITIDNMRIWVTVGDEKIFPEESDDKSDDNDSVSGESEKQATKKAKEADESSNEERKYLHYSDEGINLLMNLHRE